MLQLRDEARGFVVVTLGLLDRQIAVQSRRWIKEQGNHLQGVALQLSGDKGPR